VDSVLEYLPVLFRTWLIPRYNQSMYHDYMAKNLADRYATLNSQMDNVIKDANSEISGLRDRLESKRHHSLNLATKGYSFTDNKINNTGMHLDKKTLEQKNQELIRAFGEKSKAHQRLTKLYQRAKGTQDAQQMQYAAADDVDNVIQSMQGPGGFVEGFRDRITTQRPASLPGARGGGGGGQELPQVYSHGRVGSYGSAQKNQSWTNQGSRGEPQSFFV
jgi:E3 ubiquitin-protein ligase CCNP1IP1